MSQEETNGQIPVLTSTQDLVNAQKTEPNQEYVAKCYEFQKEIIDTYTNLVQINTSAHKVAVYYQILAAEIQLLTARLSEAASHFDNSSQDVKESNQ